MKTENCQTCAFYIRIASFPADYQAIYSLWSSAGLGVRVGRSDQIDEIANKLQRDPDLFLVAEIDNEIVGAVLGGFDGRRGLIYHLAVKQEKRNNGIGSALMQALEDQLHLKGCRRAYLLVTEDNLLAQDFYTKINWERMPLYVYGKDLDQPGQT